MLRQITDMPAGTIGFEAIGEVEDDHWENTVEPVLRREIAEGATCACSTCLALERARSRAMR